MTTSLQLLAAIARDRHGLVSRADIVHAAVTPGQLRTLRTNGALEPLGRRVYRIGGSPATERQRVLAACYDTGGIATHRTAAALHGLAGFSLTAPLEVLIRAGRRNHRTTMARVHTTTWLPDEDIVTIDTIPTMGMARTLFSLAALVPELSIEEVTAAIDEALMRNLATDKWLWWRLERLRRRGRNGVHVFETILSTRADGQVTESWLEREALRILRNAGLPLPICQARIEPQGAFVARVDFLYEHARAIIEVSGYRWHRTRAQTTADAKRRRELTLAGYQVHEFTYDEIVRSPERLVQTVRTILDLATST